MFKLNLGPIFIQVLPDRWNSYGPRTYTACVLFEYLKRSGGVSDSVSPGWYDYTLKVGLLSVEASLLPHVE